jgi:hypothetical protein
MPIADDPSLRPRPGSDDWIIQTRFRRSGDVAYVNGNAKHAVALTPFRGSATRYESEDDALEAAHDLAAKAFLNDFTVVRI